MITNIYKEIHTQFIMANDEFDWQNFNKARQTISATISTPLWNKAKSKHISWSDALEFGVAFKLAEKDDLLDFPENSLSKKISTLLEIIKEQVAEIERLKNTAQFVDAEKEADDELKKMGVFSNE